MDSYSEKGVALVDANNRRRLETIKHQREQCQMKYVAELEKYDKEISNLEAIIGDRPRVSNEVEVIRLGNDTVVTEVSLIP